MSLIRVFRMPGAYATGEYCHRPQMCTFAFVDWFRDDEGSQLVPLPDAGTPEWREMMIKFIKYKKYYQQYSTSPYLILHPMHPFTINYEAP